MTEATAANQSSMYQDVRDAARTEVDAINGYVVDAAEEANREVGVTIDQLYP